jgi:5-formyltetrahydrofolate cyclo-ligase
VSKGELRVKIREKLKSELEYVRRNHNKISVNLASLIQNLVSEKFNGRKILIGGYSPILNEPIWFDQFSGDECDFSMVHMHEERLLTYHSVNFFELKQYQEKLKLDAEKLKSEVQPDIILVPGVAFTKNFDRLGRGKAYFDNYMKNYTGLKVGLFFDLQEVISTYTEDHDEKLDYIITEKDILIRGI